MNKRMIFIAGLVVVLALAVIPAVLKQPVSKPVGGAPLVAKAAAGQLPREPWDNAWKGATAVTVPLAVVSTPGAAARDVQVRAMHDGSRIAFRLEWQDDTAETSVLRPQDFSDAAAIQLAEDVTGICMGQADRFSHIWQWKASWENPERDLAKAFPNMHVDGYQVDDKPLLTEDLFSRPAATVGNLRAGGYSSPIERHIAGSFSTLTTLDPQNVDGGGAWQKGRWAVVFIRDMKVEDSPNIQLTAGAPAQVSFAVWDGALQQRNGMKYTTNWLPLEVEAQVAGAGQPPLLALVPVGAGLFFWLGRRRRRPPQR